MKRFNRLALALLDLRTDPPNSLIIVFLCGVMILAVIGNHLHGWVAQDDEMLAFSWVRLGIMMLILFSIAIFAYSRYEKDIQERTQIVEKSETPPVKYLFTGLSPLRAFSNGDNLGNVRRLIEHHQPALQEIYLVCTLKRQGQDVEVINPKDFTAEGVKKAYETLIAWLDTNYETLPMIILLSVPDGNSAEYSFNVVSQKLTQMRAQNIPVEDVLVDVTAGTTAMSIGLASAAFINRYAVGYQATKRGVDGEPLFEETVLVKLDLQQHFRLKDE